MSVKKTKLRAGGLSLVRQWISSHWRTAVVIMSPMFGVITAVVCISNPTFVRSLGIDTYQNSMSVTSARTGITISLPKHMGFEDLSEKFKVVGLTTEGQIKWFMNVSKDQLPIVGPPVATQWSTARQLWERNMVGLYFSYNNLNTPQLPEQSQIIADSDSQILDLLKDL